jgi:hypothetical protein
MYNPQWDQGTPVAGGQGPIPAPEGAPQYIQETVPNPHPQPHIEINQPHSVSFIPDKETEGIIQSTHPELNNAMINIAIKKFALTDEFVNFYTKLEYKVAAETKAAEQAPKQEKKQEAQTQANTPPAMDFSSW